MKIIHIISGLGDGGAEGVMYRLCKNDIVNTHIIISLTDNGKYGHLLRELNKDVYILEMNFLRLNLKSYFKLFTLLKRLNPDVIQTWMYHADLIGGLFAHLTGNKNIFWNIRHSTLNHKHTKRSTILIAKLCARLSFFIPISIICCAGEALKIHSEMGYDKSKMIVIPNGYEISKFFPTDKLTHSIRDEFKFDINEPILGMIGRFHPQKDHIGLLKSLSIVKKNIPKFKFILVGFNMNDKNQILKQEIKSQDLESNIILLDQRNDIPFIMNSLDINVLSSSSGEGFPNVLAEAMACGIPCITTDVGDAKLIVSQTGWVVPPNDPILLSKAIINAINESVTNQNKWELRKKSCRKHIVQNYSIDKMISNYHLAWKA